MARPRRGSILTHLTSLADALTADLDATKFGFLHPKRIPLIKSPLADGDQPQKGEQAPESNSLKEVRTTVQSTDGGHGSPLHHHTNPFEYDPDQPQLRYETESSTIQLFYDLFFVANLTTFTGKHDVTDGGTLKSYIGYFSLLWFTWFQVALFDVRFGNDSAFERLCKAIQFGIMVGLAVEGPNYDLEDYQPNAFKTLSLILMVSRLVLAVQYTASWWWLRKYKKAHAPIFAHIATLFVSAMVLLGLSFAFSGPESVRFIDGWYVLMGVEAVTILFVSGSTPFLNFRKTNIIERLGLLTLIILGEGIMGLGEAVGKINNADGVFSPDIIGLITSGVLIVYFLYMLYFDQIESKGKKVGSLRQQIWSLGHFPFHVCILLVVEGISQFTIWQKIIDYLNQTSNEISAIDFPPSNTTTGWEGYAAAINATLMQMFNGTDANFTDPLTQIAYSGGDLDTVYSEIDNILGIVGETVAESFDFEVPKGFDDSGLDALGEIVSLFTTIFLYFFICAGLALVLLACLFMLGKKDKTRVEYMSIAIRLLVGIGLILLATMYAPVGDGSFDSNAANNFFNYFLSPWLTPTVVLAYALVVALDIVLIVFSRTMVRRRTSVSSEA